MFLSIRSHKISLFSHFLLSVRIITDRVGSMKLMKNADQWLDRNVSGLNYEKLNEWRLNGVHTRLEQHKDSIRHATLKQKRERQSWSALWYLMILVQSYAPPIPTSKTAKSTCTETETHTEFRWRTITLSIYNKGQGSRRQNNSTLTPLIRW